jgi:DNA-nicking Smr family endonuclease
LVENIFIFQEKKDINLNNKIIDLHGKDEIEATKIILMAIMDFENGSINSLEIITGNGGTLRRVLENILEDEGYS